MNYVADSVEQLECGDELRVADSDEELECVAYLYAEGVNYSIRIH